MVDLASGLPFVVGVAATVAAAAFLTGSDFFTRDAQLVIGAGTGAGAGAAGAVVAAVAAAGAAAVTVAVAVAAVVGSGWGEGSSTGGVVDALTLFTCFVASFLIVFFCCLDCFCCFCC